MYMMFIRDLSQKFNILTRPLQMANQNMARRSLRGEHYDLNKFRALVNYLKSDHITVDREPETQHISFDIDVAN